MALENKYRKTIAVGYTLNADTKELEDVHLVVPSMERAVTYRSASRGEGSNKLPVCGAVANFIYKNEEALEGPVFVGFDIRQFLTSLGVGCAIAGVYVSPKLWLSGDPSPHFDVTDVISSLHRTMGSIDAAMSHLGSSFEGKEAKSFADMTAEWSPLKDAERDGKVAFLLGSMFRIWG